MIDVSMIWEAQANLRGKIARTPCTHGNLGGVQLHLKAEMMQKTGSFKLRGAYNRLLHLTPEEKERGVIASSAGNHAQGVARAARDLGIRATIVMPANAPIYKVAATRELGARVVLHGTVYDDAYAQAMEIQKESGEVFIPPFDDAYVIAGAGTVGLEILEEKPDVTDILVPVGGGGLVSGIAVAVKSLMPAVRVIGVEPVRAPGMKRSLEKGEPVMLEQAGSIADGVNVKRPGDLTVEICKKYLDGIVLVEEDEIAGAILAVMERCKMIVEGAGALGVAAALFGKVDVEGRNVVAVLSGGNIDVTLISRILEKGLVKTGRRVTLSAIVEDRPGQLTRLLSRIGDLGANVVAIMHERDRLEVPIGLTRVDLTLETEDEAHIQRMLAELKANGYEANRM